MSLRPSFSGQSLISNRIWGFLISQHRIPYGTITLCIHPKTHLHRFYLHFNYVLSIQSWSKWLVKFYDLASYYLLYITEFFQGLQFKILCRLRVFSGQPGQFTSSANLVAAAPLYGLIFVGTSHGFQGDIFIISVLFNSYFKFCNANSLLFLVFLVLQSSKISEIQVPRGETLEYPCREISLGCAPSHLSISCDQAQLAIAYVKDGCPCAAIYDVASFCSRVSKCFLSVQKHISSIILKFYYCYFNKYILSIVCSQNISVALNIRLATSPGSKVLDFQFNPGLPKFLAACTSDGGVGVYEMKDGTFVISTLPPAMHCTLV